MLQERYPAWAEKVEFWHVDDAPEVPGLIEREVMGLVARILGGGDRQDAAAPKTSLEPARQASSEPPKKDLDFSDDVWSSVRPALCYDLCAREEADAVLAILVKVAES